MDFIGPSGSGLTVGKVPGVTMKSPPGDVSKEGRPLPLPLVLIGGLVTVLPALILSSM